MAPRPACPGLRLAAAALLVSLSVACEDHVTAGWEFEGQVSRSTFWEYHDSLFEPLCPTLLDRLDEHTRVVGGKIGLTVAGDHPLRFYRFQDATGLATGCPVGVPACADGDAVLAMEPFYAHEQVHAYVARAWNSWSVGLLNEGEAVALSCDPAYTPQRGMSPRDALGAGDWRPFLYLFGNSASGYAAAGHLVTYLARSYGWQKVGELHRRVPPGLSAEDFAVEFARVFPISMDQAWSQALNGSHPPCDNEWACRATDMSVGEVAQPDCDGELHRVIQISGESGVVISQRKGYLRLRSCTDVVAPVYELRSGKGAVTTHWASLPPGRYAMSGNPAPSEVTLVSTLTSPLFAADCEQAAQVRVTPAEYTFVDLLPGTMDGCLRVDGGGTTYRLAFHDVEFSTSGDASLCESGAPGAPCVPVSTYGATTATVGAKAVLRVQGARSEPAASMSWGRIVFYPVPPGDGGT